MRKSLQALLLVTALPFAGQALAQTVAPDNNPPATTRSAKSPPQQQLYRGTKIIGKAVRDPNDRKIGEIKDLLLDGGRGEVAYAIVSFGGAAKGGRKWHAVPWQALEPGNDGRYYLLQADRETIIQAPGFDKTKWPDMTDRKWSAEVDRYWSRMVGRGTFGSNRLVPGAAGTGNAPAPDGRNSGR